MTGPLLQVEELTVSYGGLRAVDGVDLAVEAGQLVGLIGANGAGKTTVIDAVTGFVPSGGRVVLDGVGISGMKPHRRARAGLGRTWQGEELFDDLTVYDNVRVGCERLGFAGGLADLLRPRRHRHLPAIDAALRRFDLAGLAERMPSELSLAHRKLVGVARTLAAGPRIVCMDEPAAGLGAAESRELGRQLRDIVANGIGLLLVDHDMGLVLSVCDHIYVLEAGRLLAAGTPETIRSDPRVIASYLGQDGAPSVGVGASGARL